jgi:HrpA-like RNA helicase
MTRFVTEPCSQASANQRTGRAGRTREGHCYRMYSSAFYVHHMAAHDVPHALRVPSEELLMQLLALGVSRPVTFPLPSSPDPQTLMDAAARLHTLGLLTSARMPLRLTMMGSRAMSLPVSPAQARLVLTSDSVRLACAICGVWSAQQLLPSDKPSLSNDATMSSWWKRACSMCDVMGLVYQV